MNSLYKRILGCTVLLMIGVIALTHRNVPIHPFGKMATGQVLDQSEALYRAITLRTGTLHILANPSVTYRHDGSQIRHWLAQAGDAPETPQVVFDWNADTGELIGFISGNP